MMYGSISASEVGSVAQDVEVVPLVEEKYRHPAALYQSQLRWTGDKVAQVTVAAVGSHGYQQRVPWF